MDAPVFGVERIVLRHGGRDVDSGTAQFPGCLLSWQAADLGGDDGAAGLAEVVGCHARQFTELVTEPGTQRGGALADRLQAQAEGLPDGRA